MPALNRSERTVIYVGTCMVLLGTLVRVALEPEPERLRWQPSRADRPAQTIGELRTAVSRSLEAEAQAARPLGPEERIDLNSADESTLRRLPGIGPSRAAAIVRFRRDNGPFRSPEALTGVPGIGPSTLDRLRPHLRAADSRTGFSSGRLDLNRAQIKDLEQITGIGPALARRIVTVRKARTRFRSIDELVDVPGIGLKTVDELRHTLYVR